MVTNKRKKVRRQRGTNTYGWGRNQHRKAGSRGGVGNAGTGKKCHANKPKVWTNPNFFGKRGFTRLSGGNDECVINLGDVQDRLDSWKKRGLVADKSGVFEVDLGKLGYDRLLGSGTLKSKVKITVASAAKTAGKKVEAAGGELVVTSSK